MFNRYEDITERMAEPPKWWDEQGVPRYADFGPHLIWNIYAHETALVEIACSRCGDRFQVAFSNRSPWPEALGNCKTIAEAIEKGELHYGDPPHYGNCEIGASMRCYDLRVLQYWSRSLPMRNWTRDSRLEIELPDNRELDKVSAQPRVTCDNACYRQLPCDSTWLLLSARITSGLLVTRQEPQISLTPLELAAFFLDSVE